MLATLHEDGGSVSLRLDDPVVVRYIAEYGSRANLSQVASMISSCVAALLARDESRVEADQAALGAAVGKIIRGAGGGAPLTGDGPSKPLIKACDLCSRSFTNQSGLSRHITDKHKGTPQAAAILARIGRNAKDDPSSAFDPPELNEDDNQAPESASEGVSGDDGVPGGVLADDREAIPELHVTPLEGMNAVLHSD